MLLGFALGGLLYRVFVELLVAGCLAGLIVNINGVCAVDLSPSMVKVLNIDL